MIITHVTIVNPDGTVTYEDREVPDDYFGTPPVPEVTAEDILNALLGMAANE